MSVKDAIFPLVLTVSFFSINYKTAVSASSTPLQLSVKAIEVPINTAENTPKPQPAKPSCEDRVCPK